MAAGLLGGRTLADPHSAGGQVVLRGVAWGAIVALAIATGPWPLALVLGGLAAAASWEIAVASAETDYPVEPVFAAVLAAALPAAAYFDTAAAGAVLVAGVVGSVAIAWFLRTSDTPLMALAGAYVEAWGFTGLAAAGVMFTWRVELGAVVVLCAFVAIYDIGSHLVGADAGSAWEGPVSGVVGVGVVAFAAAAIGVPPFELDGAASFALVAAAALPFGPVLASLLVPAGESPPALRRIDSLLVIGPIWPVLVGLYVQSL